VTYTVGAALERDGNRHLQHRRHDTLCTATLPALSCAAGNAPVGSDTVTASYSGDSNFAPQVTTTTLTIIKATPSFTEAAAPASIVYGSQDTLSVSGMPRWGDGHRDVHLGWIDALHRNAAGHELPHGNLARGGHLPGHRNVLR
jgi:hypothetical protein